MKVKNMTSARGLAVPNQLIIEDEKGIYFQSYGSIIAFKPNIPWVEGEKYAMGSHPTQLDINKWDYSRMTGKYRNQFLGESKAETQKKIDSGEYELVDLNN